MFHFLPHHQFALGRKVIKNTVYDNEDDAEDTMHVTEAVTVKMHDPATHRNRWDLDRDTVRCSELAQLFISKEFS